MQSPNEQAIDAAPLPLLSQLYAAILLVDGGELLAILENNQSIIQTLFSLPIKEANGANIIQAILTKLDAIWENEAESEVLFACLSEIISKYPNELNLKFTDAKNNTVLHQVFWYAIKERKAYSLIDEERMLQTSKQFETISHELIKTILPADFRQIMAIENNLGGTFLDYIYISSPEKRIRFDSKLSDLKYKTDRHFSKRVQDGIVPFLDSFRNKLSQTLGEKLDFDEQDFPDRLAEILNDGITYELMDDPYIDNDGYTYDRITYDNLLGDELEAPHPITRHLFRSDELLPHNRVKEIIECYKLYQHDNKIFNSSYLDQKLSNLFLEKYKEEQIAQFSDNAARDPVLSFKSRELKHLIESYHIFLNSKPKPVSQDIAASKPDLSASLAKYDQKMIEDERQIVQYLQTIPSDNKPGQWFELGSSLKVGIGKLLKVPAIATVEYQINSVKGHLIIWDKKNNREINDKLDKSGIFDQFVRGIYREEANAKAVATEKAKFAALEESFAANKAKLAAAADAELAIANARLAAANAKLAAVTDLIACEKPIVQYLVVGRPQDIKRGQWLPMGDGFEIGKSYRLNAPAIANTNHQITLSEGHLIIWDKKTDKGVDDIQKKIMILTSFAQKIAPASVVEQSSPAVHAASASSSSSAAAAASPFGFFPPSSEPKILAPSGFLLKALLSLIAEIKLSIPKDDHSLTVGNFKTIEFYMLDVLSENSTITKDKELRLLGMISALGESAPDYPINILIEAFIDPNEVSASSKFKDEARNIFAVASSAAAASAPRTLVMSAESINHFLNIDKVMSAQNVPKA